MRITVDRFAKTEDATQLLYRSGGVCSAEKRPIVRKPDSVRNEENKSSRIKRFGGDGGSPTRDLGVRSASLYASELRPRCSHYNGKHDETALTVPDSPCSFHSMIVWYYPLRRPFSTQQTGLRNNSDKWVPPNGGHHEP